MGRQATCFDAGTGERGAHPPVSEHHVRPNVRRARVSPRRSPWGQRRSRRGGRLHRRSAPITCTAGAGCCDRRNTTSTHCSSSNTANVQSPSGSSPARHRHATAHDARRQQQRVIPRRVRIGSDRGQTQESQRSADRAIVESGRVRDLGPTLTPFVLPIVGRCHLVIGFTRTRRGNSR